MAKKILIITDNLPSQINGVVTTYTNIEPYAVADGYSVEYIHPGQFRHINCPKYNEVKLAYPFGLAEKIAQINPDFIHIATEGPVGVFARKYLTKNKYRYTSAYHTKFPEGLHALLGVPTWVTWPAVKWFHKNSNKVLTTTTSMVEQLKAHGFGNNVVSWTRGVDRTIFSPGKEHTELSGPVLVCVSRISVEKNLTAFFELSYPGTKIMVGDGPMLESYREKYSDVIFVGAKRGTELAYYYNVADCFVFPSRWDTFGLVMIEAQACGTPVAAFPVQGPLDVIEQGVSGYMHDNLEIAIEQCLALDRLAVYQSSLKWSWQTAWDIFRDSLVDIDEN